ncbi:hypothetical protein ZWY2020_020514 [Hordeum vulgare]|nr:hypothetical protein ZWY2020_020514 [Hordeum vulgare]
MAPPFLKTGHGRDSRFSFRRRKSGQGVVHALLAALVGVVLGVVGGRPPRRSPTMDPSAKTQTLPCARQALSRSSCGSGQVVRRPHPAAARRQPPAAQVVHVRRAAPKPAPGPRPAFRRSSQAAAGEDMSAPARSFVGSRSVQCHHQSRLCVLSRDGTLLQLPCSVVAASQPMAPEQKAQWTRRSTSFSRLPISSSSSFLHARRQRMAAPWRDLLMNIPALLHKLNGMLLDYLDSFSDKQEFWYVKKNDNESENGDSEQSDKWWLHGQGPLMHQKELVNQVLKATMAINANVLMEMDVSRSLHGTLPKVIHKNTRTLLYKWEIYTWGLDVQAYNRRLFRPEELIAVDLDEYNIVDLKNRIEASVVIWQKKMQRNDKEAENVLLLLKHRFPGISQSALDISKIQYNRDVGSAILELLQNTGNLAYTVMSRIEAFSTPTPHPRPQERGLDEDASLTSGRATDLTVVRRPKKGEMGRLGRMEQLTSTLFDFVGPQGSSIETMILESLWIPRVKAEQVCKSAPKVLLPGQTRIWWNKGPISRH